MAGERQSANLALFCASLDPLLAGLGMRGGAILVTSGAAPSRGGILWGPMRRRKPALEARMRRLCGRDREDEDPRDDAQPRTAAHPHARLGLPGRKARDPAQP